MNLSMYLFDHLVVRRRLSSPQMQDFTAATVDLIAREHPKALEWLSPFLQDRDVYRRRYVLEHIWHLPGSHVLIPELEKILLEEQWLLVSTGLQAVVRHDLPVSMEVLLSAWWRFPLQLDGRTLTPLKRLPHEERSYELLLHLYRRLAGNDQCQWDIASLLLEQYPEHFDAVFQLMVAHSYVHIRYTAARAAALGGRMDLVEPFRFDPNGHFRKLVRQAEAGTLKP